jgi:hypothetical protein
MGIAHGFASTVILRAESPVDADGFRQSNASWGGLTALNPALGFLSWPVGPGWYGNGPLALKSVNGVSPVHCFSSGAMGT